MTSDGSGTATTTTEHELQQCWPDDPDTGVPPLPISSLKSSFPVLGNPANRSRAVPLTYEQFRYGFANASYQQREGDPGVTEIVEVQDRGHALTVDSGWRQVADTALAFVKRFL